MDLIAWDIFHPKPLWAHTKECENCWCSLKASETWAETSPLHRGHPATTTERQSYTEPAGGPPARHVLGIFFNSPSANPPLSPVTHYFASQGGTYWRNYTLALIFIYLAFLIWKRRFSCIIKPVVRDCPERFLTDVLIIRQKLLSKFYAH